MFHILVVLFFKIIPGSLVRQFDAQELEFVIAGVLEVDVDDWRENTDYRAGQCERYVSTCVHVP